MGSGECGVWRRGVEEGYEMISVGIVSSWGVQCEGAVGCITRQGWGLTCSMREGMAEG